MTKKSYRDEVWKLSLSKAAKKYNTKTDIVKVAFSVPYIVLVIIILAGLGLWNEKESIPALIWGLFGADLLAILATLFSIPILAYFDMWNVAAERDAEQEKTINELSTRNEKIFVENFDYYDPENPSEHKTGIVIYNKNNTPLTDISIELIETNWEKQDTDGNIYLEEKIGTMADNSHFRNWASKSKNTVNAKDKETIYFYQVELGVAVALLENRKYQFTPNIPSGEKEAVSYIEIIFEVRGKIGDHLFEKRYRQRTKYISFIIQSNPNDSIQIIRTRDYNSIVICDGNIMEIDQ